jgi:leucyl/phenylalanyl-tRNA--protein transferase
LRIPELNKYNLNFPDPRDANEDGIVAWGGDLNPSRLIKAYSLGIFPWNSPQDPILWWSPQPRLILELEDFKLRKSLKKKLKCFEYKFDTNFRDVLDKCASTPRPGQGGTWLNNELIESFEVLHGMGIAHSVEAYQDGVLVGGLYGLSIGKVFCGESMFAHVSDASKAAFSVLIAHLKEWGYEFIDAQVPTQHLQSLGAKEVAREYFLMRLDKVKMDTINNVWRVEKKLVEKLKS